MMAKTCPSDVSDKKPNALFAVRRQVRPRELHGVMLYRSEQNR